MIDTSYNKNRYKKKGSVFNPPRQTNLLLHIEQAAAPDLSVIFSPGFKNSQSHELVFTSPVLPH